MQVGWGAQDPDVEGYHVLFSGAGSGEVGAADLCDPEQTSQVDYIIYVRQT